MNTEVQIIVNGKPVRSYWHQNKWWVEARKGCSYEIKVKNLGPNRIEAVVSVDGLDVITGTPADDNSTGYVINGYRSYNIKGYRVSDNEVNKFVFAEKEASYAAVGEQGEKSTSNCGVIAVRVYEEKWSKVPEPYWSDNIKPNWPNYPWDKTPILYRSLDIAAPSSVDTSHYVCDSMSSDTSKEHFGIACASFDMGTKFSEEKIQDNVTRTTFERSGKMTESTFYYASREALISFGVPVEKPIPEIVFPQAFKGFCKPPKKSLTSP